VMTRCSAGDVAGGGSGVAAANNLTHAADESKCSRSESASNRMLLVSPIVDVMKAVRH